MFLEDVERTPATIQSAWEYSHEEQFPAFLTSARRFWLVGMGASYSVCLSLAVILRMQGIQAEAEQASTMLHFTSASVAPEDCVILISQSGESAETVRLAQQLAEQGITSTLALTNNLSSSLSQYTSAACEMHCPADDAVSVTTYIASFLILTKLAFFVKGVEKPPIAPVVAEAERMLQYKNIGSKVLDATGVPAGITVLGRGPLVGAAYEAGLILREVTKLPTSVWETGDFRHGIIEAVQPDQLTLFFAIAHGSAAPLDAALAAKLEQIPGKLFVLGPEQSHMPIHVPLYYRPIIDVMITQYLAVELARRQQITPGTFKWASHVTTSEA